MKKILIVTALYKRFELTRIVLNHYHAMQARMLGEIELQLLCVGSQALASQNLAESCGWDYIEHSNEPLCQKFNHLFEKARDYDPDLLVLIGSDDLLSDDIIRYYNATVPSDYPDLIGLSDLYFYSIETRHTIYFPGYGPPAPKTIGAGRCFSRFILKAMRYRPWRNEIINRGLDSSSSHTMRKLGIAEVTLPMATVGVAVDIKDPRVSLTGFRKVQIRSQPANTDLLVNTFPEPMREILNLNKNRVLLG